MFFWPWLRKSNFESCSREALLLYELSAREIEKVHRALALLVVGGAGMRAWVLLVTEGPWVVILYARRKKKDGSRNTVLGHMIRVSLCEIKRTMWPG